MTTAPMSESLHHPGFTVPRRMTISTESRVLLWLAVLGAATLSAVTFMLSFAGLVDVAAWANIRPSLRWAVPVFIDGAIIVYTVAVLVERGRGQRPIFAWTALATFTVVSVSANGSHAWAAHGVLTWQTVVGTLIAALPPLGQLAATHTMARLVVEPPPAHSRPAPEPTTAHDPEPTDRQPRPAIEQTTTATTHPLRELPVRAAGPREAEAGADEQAPAYDDRAQRILQLRRQGMSQRAIAQELGCGKSTVARTINARDGQGETVPRSR
ncbi:DUF2637 domain-containing protein [Mumia sp. zg.B17]|uniref:DUF2637 domain-containing protein n=1 Tax=Mumia sp. zg.B17 TaxID=2855446 RepID=UPI001C6EC90A|nr:DUF2637 domain-containing protein [Mumia sp. zg.B17]MBW9207977.1 DUF2637 domain-containing protein [Mumia sp. zg.B17]